MKGIIYLIVGLETGKKYVGSSSRNLHDTKLSHQASSNRWLQGKTNYRYSYKIICNERWDIKLLEEFEIDGSADKRKREQYWIDKYGDDCVNKNKAFTSDEEKIQQRKDISKEWQEVTRICFCGKEVKQNCWKPHVNSERHYLKIVNSGNPYKWKKLLRDREEEATFKFFRTLNK